MIGRSNQAGDDDMGAAGVAVWVTVGSEAELRRRQRLVVEADPDDIVVWWHDGRPRALRNVCIHESRLLSEGSLLGSRVVCPGHQWAFDLETGYCKERDRHQPTFATRVEDGQVFVNPTPDQPADRS